MEQFYNPLQMNLKANDTTIHDWTNLGTLFRDKEGVKAIKLNNNSITAPLATHPSLTTTHT